MKPPDLVRVVPSPRATQESAPPIPPWTRLRSPTELRGFRAPLPVERRDRQSPKHGVLALQGPSHYPRFYGQLERQNRDHRAWLDGLGTLPANQLQPQCDRMRTALNDHWPRRALGWSTPAEIWARRPPITRELRDSFQQEVYDRAARLEQHLDHDNDLAMRLAIEQALTQRGYLRLEQRGRC